MKVVVAISYNFFQISPVHLVSVEILTKQQLIRNWTLAQEPQLRIKRKALQTLPYLAFLLFLTRHLNHS